MAKGIKTEQPEALEAGKGAHRVHLEDHRPFGKCKVETTGLQDTGRRMSVATEPNAGSSICQEISANHHRYSQILKSKI